MKHNIVNRRRGALERLKAATNPHPTDTKEGAKKHAQWNDRVPQEIETLESRLKHATV